MSDPSAPSLDLLLSQAAWIRALARRLVHDPDTAEEIAQRTLIAAVRRDPDETRPIRAWLTVIVKNLARSTRRGQARRAKHEAIAARSEALPSTSDVVERAQMQRELVEAVLELDEPYRTVILFRYYDGKAPHAIARELGLPQATVRTQIARGLAKLRARLDGEHGNRAAWLALLLPVAERGGPLSPTLAGALLVTAKTKAILATACALVAIAAILRFLDAPAREDSLASAPRAEAKLAGGESERPNVLATAGTAESVREAAEPEAGPAAAKVAAPTAPPSAPARWRGKVIDIEGKAKGQVEVALSRTKISGDSAPREGLAVLAVTDARGAFDSEAQRESGYLVARNPDLATVISALVDKGASAAPVIVVAPKLSLDGSVVDESGAPLANAVVYVTLPETFRTRFHENLDDSEDEGWSAMSGADGAYHLAVIPRIPEAKLEVRLAGYTPFSLRLEEIQGSPYVIALSKPGVAEKTLRGHVVDATGAVVPEARVSLGIEATKTDDRGAFAFRLDDPNGYNASFRVNPVKLQAAKKGLLPASLDAEIVDGRPAWPESVTLRLGSTALSISGRVIDHLGETRSGIKVFVTDPTVLGVEGGLIHLESLIAGREDRVWRYTETDSEGRFEIDGLAERTYTVRAMEPDTLLRTELEGVGAGEVGVELRMAKDALHPRVAGRVRGHDGTGIAKARIFPMCDAFQSRLGGQIVSTNHDSLKGTVTDAEGNFELEDVPKSLVYLRIESDEILPLEYGRYVEGDKRFEQAAVKDLPPEKIESLDIRVDRRAHVQVELADPTSADEFALLDEHGAGIEVSVFMGNGRREGMKAPIVEGRSNVVGGSDRARTIVLYKGESEVVRMAVALKPGETKIVRY